MFTHAHPSPLPAVFLAVILGALLVGCTDDEEPQPAPPDQPVPVAEKVPPPPFSGSLGPEFQAIGGLENSPPEFGPHDLPRRVRHTPTGIVLVLIPSGEYTMGTPDDEHERERDEAQRTVSVARPFYLAETELTVGQWKQFMKEASLSAAEKKNDELPKSGVSWKQATELLKRFNDKYEKGWRLPQEVEWEFACRAGTITPFSCGTDIAPQQANFDGRYPYRGRERVLDRGAPMPVRSFPPNPWGLFDMHGNLWEWCSDFYVSHPELGKTPRGAPGDSRVIRGGGYTASAKQLRSGYRDGYPPSSDGAKYGLRVAKSILSE